MIKLTITTAFKHVVQEIVNLEGHLSWHLQAEVQEGNHFSKKSDYLEQ
jgi:hypothetical protein